MTRLARVVIPGLAHHITQRGNGAQQVFFDDSDYAWYRQLLMASCRATRVSCLAYCLMPNHVHLILVPTAEDGLARCLSSVHHAYAWALNDRFGRTGHFWQGRFGSVAMDEHHLYQAFRYVLLNPVRARLAERAHDWPWSSARVYLRGEHDGLTTPWRMLGLVGDVHAYLGESADAVAIERIRDAESTGRPAADDAMLARLEQATGRQLRPGRRGPKVRRSAVQSECHRINENVQ